MSEVVWVMGSNRITGVDGINDCVCVICGDCIIGVELEGINKDVCVTTEDWVSVAVSDMQVLLFWFVKTIGVSEKKLNYLIIFYDYYNRGKMGIEERIVTNWPYA